MFVLLTFLLDLDIRDSWCVKNIRHPMYTAVFMLSLSQLSLIGNWVVGPAYFLAFFFLYVLRVKHEEALMLEHYGDEYSAYMKRTGRLFPRF